MIQKKKASTVRRPVVPSTPVRQTAASPLLLALEARNIDRLRRVLVAHPGAWKTLFSSYPKKEPRVPLAHRLIDMDWPAALKVLAEAGDDFSLESKGPRPKSALAWATKHTKIMAIEKLLALGAPVNGHPDQAPPMAAMVTSSPRVSKKKAAMEVLLAAGANAWAAVSPTAAGQGLTLPEAFLQSGQPELALMLLQASPIPSSVRGRPLDFYAHWVRGMDNENLKMRLQENLLRELHHQSFLPPFSFWVDQYVNGMEAMRFRKHMKEAMVWLMNAQIKEYPAEPVALETLDAMAPHEELGALHRELHLRRLNRHLQESPVPSGKSRRL